MHGFNEVGTDSAPPTQPLEESTKRLETLISEFSVRYETALKLVPKKELRVMMAQGLANGLSSK